MTGPVVYSPNRIRELVEACANDFGRFAYDGFGIMLSDQQLEARYTIGDPGPRRPGEFKFNWLSGGQRAGKTVFGFLMHAEAALYKRGLDVTDRRYWHAYQYGTLAIAPTEQLALRLWVIGDEVSKGSNDSQYDRKVRRSRGGAFLDRIKAGKDDKWPVWRFTNGAKTDFRSSEGYAYRLEGGQWWWVTWDEWASQPDREIHKVRTDVLMGRARDHDAKIMPMAWPKEETEHHLISVLREIEAGRDRDSTVVYLEADKAFFTNTTALEVELRAKTPSQILRTIKGRPAGGASKEFKPHVVDHMTRVELPERVMPEEGYDHFDSWDIGLANDSTVGITWRIPIVGGRRVVSPEFKARIVNTIELPGSETRTIEDITWAIMSNQRVYRSQVAVDATGMGGLMAARGLREMNPRPYEFKSRSNDRVYGNMRLASITNALDCVSWGFDEVNPTAPWGLVEMPRIVQLLDQLANFDRDAKNVADDWVWSFIIGLWYIRRWWVVGQPGIHEQHSFDVRGDSEPVVLVRRKRGSYDQRSRLIGGPGSEPPRQVFIRNGTRFDPRGR